ncbi:MAG: hypothetical protein EXR07_18780 [Acetobacteraceae bacterium]|nr:hypothetical protein [Acetobacteraceae bacterium]
MANGLLFASFDFSPSQEDEFHDWYDLEHIPERLRVPGFLNAQRWLSVEHPKVAVATYDLTSHAVFSSPEYRAIGYENASIWTKRVTAIAKRILRFEGDQIVPGDATGPDAAAALLSVAMNVDPAAEAEFNEWYNSEHLPQLGSVPGVLSARRFRSAGPGMERKYLALYHMTSIDVTKSDAWKTAANTPWTDKMRPRFRDMLALRCVRYHRDD